MALFRPTIRPAPACTRGDRLWFGRPPPTVAQTDGHDEARLRGIRAPPARTSAQPVRDPARLRYGFLAVLIVGLDYAVTVAGKTSDGAAAENIVVRLRLFRVTSPEKERNGLEQFAERVRRGRSRPGQRISLG
jgi:hypothetical protein